MLNGELGALKVSKAHSKCSMAVREYLGDDVPCLRCT